MSLSDRDPKVRGRLFLALARALDLHQVIAPPPENVLRTGVAFLRLLHRAAVGFHPHRRGAVAKVPHLIRPGTAAGCD